MTRVRFFGRREAVAFFRRGSYSGVFGIHRDETFIHTDTDGPVGLSGEKLLCERRRKKSEIRTIQYHHVRGERTGRDCYERDLK